MRELILKQQWPGVPKQMQLKKMTTKFNEKQENARNEKHRFEVNEKQRLDLHQVVKTKFLEMDYYPRWEVIKRMKLPVIIKMNL